MSDTGIWRQGFSGAFTPENVSTCLAQIETALDTHSDKPTAPRNDTYWIEASKSLRNNEDELDLPLCQRLLERVEVFWVAGQHKRGAIWGGGFQDVANLTDMWLDWWAIATQYDPVEWVVPAKDSQFTTVLSRVHGEYHRPRPDYSELFGSEQITLMPNGEESWLAYSAKEPENVMIGGNMVEAGLRALVVKYFGRIVPCNPAIIVKAFII